MKKRVYFFLLFSSFIFSSNIFGYDYLYIRDPKNPWRGGYGTIEEATFTVKPKGVFAEISIYMSFSAKGLGFTHSDSLEVEFYFQLEKDAVFNDLWLWIGNDIMKALIMDQWTASSIYENIVKRRRDPALLRKSYEGTYDLRIYPLAGDETRKIKMTYLIPLTWLNTSVSAALPFHMVKASVIPLGELSIITYPDQVWKNPGITEVNTKFRTEKDEQIGEYSQMKIPVDMNLSSLSLTFDAPSSNGKFLSIFGNNATSYYQLAIFPTQILDINLSQKVVVLVDYDITKSPATKDELLAAVKTFAKGQLSSKDSFNVVFSKLNPVRLSNTWLSSDPQVIENAFATISQNPIANYSNLPAGLLDAIEFIEQNGNDGKIFIISNSDEYGDYQKANQLINDLKEKIKTNIPFYIADFTTQNYQYYYIGDRYYTGNEYFYTNLARMSKGEYIKSTYNEPLMNVILKTANTLRGFITNFDLSTSLNEGFTYGKMTNSSLSQSVSVSDAIIQFGKYYGEMPLTLQLSGTYNSQVFSKKIELSSSTILLGDSTIEQMWTGKYINLLEKEQYSNDLVNEIVETSVSKRVLSIYSAFLALEPNDTIKFCKTCFDESGLSTDVKDHPITFNDSLKIQAYPNPFNSQTKIKVQLPGLFNAEQLSLKIYDIIGQEIKTFNSVDFANKQIIELSWNGSSDSGENVSSGIYLFVVSTPTARQSYKLLNLK